PCPSRLGGEGVLGDALEIVRGISFLTRVVHGKRLPKATGLRWEGLVIGALSVRSFASGRRRNDTGKRRAVRPPGRRLSHAPIIPQASAIGRPRWAAPCAARRRCVPRGPASPPSRRTCPRRRSRVA